MDKETGGKATPDPFLCITSMLRAATSKADEISLVLHPVFSKFHVWNVCVIVQSSKNEISDMV